MSETRISNNGIQELKTHSHILFMSKDFAAFLYALCCLFAYLLFYRGRMTKATQKKTAKEKKYNCDKIAFCGDQEIPQML